MVHIKLNRNESILNGANIDKLKEFRRQQLFTDVILICEDKLYPAHKIVITASANNNTRTKLLFPNLNYSTVLMTGVSPHDVENLLCFLYAGEIWIPHTEVKGFLKAARILQVDRIEPNSEVEIPPEMLFQNAENKISTPLQNVNNGNASHSVSNRPRAGLGNTNRPALVSQIDQENVYYDVSRSMNVSHHHPHNNTQVSSRLSTNAFNSSSTMRNTTSVLALQQHQQRRQKTTLCKKKTSSFSSKHPPEKFRAAVHYNDGVELIHSLISPCAENDDATQIGNYENSIPSPTDSPVPAVNEDSWNVFQLTEVGNTDTYGYDNSIQKEASVKIREKSSENSHPPLAPKTTSLFQASKVSHPKTSTPRNKGGKPRSLSYSPRRNAVDLSDGKVQQTDSNKNDHHFESNYSVTPTTSKKVEKEIRSLPPNNQKLEKKRKNIKPEFSKTQNTNERLLRSRNITNNANATNNIKCHISSSTPFRYNTAVTVEDQMKRNIMSSGREIRIILQDVRKERIQNIEIGNMAKTKVGTKGNKHIAVKMPKPKTINNKKKKLADNENAVESRQQASGMESNSSRKCESGDKRKVLRARKPRGCTLNNNNGNGVQQSTTKRVRTTTARGVKNKQADNPNMQERLRKRVKKTTV